MGMEENVDEKTRDTPWKLYVASVYFTSYTLTSVGYGDIGPVNIVERLTCTLMLVISGTSWAVVLGQVCGIVATMNADEKLFRRTMDELSLMIREEHMDKEVRQRLRSFFHSNKHAQRRQRRQEHVANMSPGLRGEVAIQINKKWVSKVSLLNNLLKEAESPKTGRFFRSFIVDVCLALQLQVHAQSESFGKLHTLYILNRGIVSRPPRLHHQGAVWGTDFILSDDHLIEKRETLALTYIEVTVLTREGFFDNLFKYRDQCQDLLKSVRRFCCWLAFQRALLKEAKRRRRALREKDSGTEDDH